MLDGLLDGACLLPTTVVKISGKACNKYDEMVDRDSS